MKEYDALGCYNKSRTVQCQALAMVDILLLSQSRSLLVSKPSSFSDVVFMMKYARLPSSEEIGCILCNLKRANFDSIL